MLFLLLREATFLPTADKRNDKKCNKKYAKKTVVLTPQRP